MSPALAALGLAALIAAPNPEPADARQMDALWADLEKGDAEASRALLKLADRPKEAVVFLREKLPPLKASEERVRELLADLGKDDEKTWKAAFEELEYFDPRLAISLETLMDKVKDAPARQRMVAVLDGRDPKQLEGKAITLRRVGDDGFNFSADNSSWWAEHRVDRLGRWGGKKKWTRATRAIVLLEHVATPDAVGVLRRLATGHPDAGPTKEAKSAFVRLSAKPPAKPATLTP